MSQAQLPLLSFVGPTAAGKTSAALQSIESLKQNKNFSGFDLIVADSRQVYQGLEITSGADLPADAVKITDPDFSYPLYEQGELRFWGLAMISPSDEWSLAHFRRFCQSIIAWSFEHHRLPIIVGGTGLFHEYALSSEPSFNIPPDLVWRKQAAEIELESLQQLLSEEDPDHWQKMNQSDRSNPYRLIRAIEKHRAVLPEVTQPTEMDDHQNISIGITADISLLENKIRQRVIERIEQGSINEVERLLSSEQPPTKQALSATGVKEMTAFINGQIENSQLIDLWTKREVNYAKRQLTWWKKYGKDVHWFESTKPNWLNGVIQFVISNFPEV